MTRLELSIEDLENICSWFYLYDYQQGCNNSDKCNPMISEDNPDAKTIVKIKCMLLVEKERAATSHYLPGFLRGSND